MIRLCILSAATIVAVLLITCQGITVRPFEMDLRLPALSRSKRCRVVLDHDPPRSQRSLRVPEFGTENSRKQTVRIVNGDVASPKLVPYLVAIFKFDEELDMWSSECTGTLVSSRWIISAAFCNVTSVDKVLLLGRNLADFAGTDNELATIADIASVTPHANYDKTEAGSRYDIIAIELAKDAPKDAKFMKVNVNSALPETESFVRVAGFGITETELTNPNRNRDLLQVDVPTTTFEECSEAFQQVSGVSIDRDAHVCAGYLNRGQCDSW